MPTNRITMRRIRETLRLHLQAGLSYNEISRALKISKSAAGKCVSLARAAAVDWDVGILGDSLVATAMCIDEGLRGLKRRSSSRICEICVGLAQDFIGANCWKILSCPANAHLYKC